MQIHVFRWFNFALWNRREKIKICHTARSISPIYELRRTSVVDSTFLTSVPNGCTRVYNLHLRSATQGVNPSPHESYIRGKIYIFNSLVAFAWNTLMCFLYTLNNDTSRGGHDNFFCEFCHSRNFRVPRRVHWHQTRTHQVLVLAYFWSTHVRRPAKQDKRFLVCAVWKTVVGVSATIICISTCGHQRYQKIK
jgi:hypothetical protein